MKQLLTAVLVLTSLLFAQTAKADETNQATANQTSAIQLTSPAPEPIVISWDRVGGKEKWWV